MKWSFLQFLAFAGSLPFLEFLILHYGFGLSFGFGIYTNTNLIPIIFTLLVLLLILQTKQPHRVSFSPITLAINVGSLGLSVWMNLQYKDGGFGTTALAGAGFAAGYFVMASPVDTLKAMREHPLSTVSAVLSICLLLAYIQVSNFLWEVLAPVTTGLAVELLNLFGLDVILRGDRIISHPLFAAHIAGPCSGTESLTVFTFAALSLLMMEPERFSPGKWIFLFGIGFGFVYLMNIIRIAAYFSLSVHSSRSATPQVGLFSFPGLFHGEVSWIYCLATVSFFFMLALKAIPERK